MDHWRRARYQVNQPLYEGQKRVTEGDSHLKLAREAAREGMILLKNDNEMLPLRGGAKAALFGKGVFDYVRGGGGSGEVTCAYEINLYEGLKQQADPLKIYEPLCDFYRENVAGQMKNGAAPGLTVEPAIPEALLKGAAEFTDTAIIVISRFSGEAWDRKSVSYPGQETWEFDFIALSEKLFPDSDFYLTAEEKAMVETVCENFSHVAVVLNIGGMMDVKWIAEDSRISSALLAWQGGMEGGLATADLLMGAVNPSGKLPDTFAGDLDDYPSTAGFHDSPDYVDYTEDIYVGYRYFETIPGMKGKVIYPFGYGLSYTGFSININSAEETDGQIQISTVVTNTGKTAGREVVQVYFGAPQGLLGKPARQLAAFAKTRLLEPGEAQEITLSFPINDMASYDDLGKVQKSAYILEEGEYCFYVGNNVRDAEELPFKLNLKENKIVKQLSAKLEPTQLAKRLLADGSFETLPESEPFDYRENGIGWEGFPEGICLSPKTRATDYMQYFGDTGHIRFDEVADGKVTLDEFMAQLSIDDKIHLLGGQPNTGVANTLGFGNLPEYGVPSLMTADGPAGLRIRPEVGVNTTAFPVAVLLASTWDPELVEKVGFAAGEEVKENNIFVWLAPAICIHRSPLCGRNFEYYSEDPTLTGILSGAMVRGIQRNGVAAAIKHFACNNKETNRRYSDSRLSERALREIYLKGFEIAWKTGHFWSLMSSYNVINGRRASESPELLTDILRNEWGFDGLVMSDWWGSGEQYKEINAGNDVKMGCGFDERVRKAYDKGLVSEEAITTSAHRVLELILKCEE